MARDTGGKNIVRGHHELTTSEKPTNVRNSLDLSSCLSTYRAHDEERQVIQLEEHFLEGDKRSRRKAQKAKRKQPHVYLALTLI